MKFPDSEKCFIRELLETEDSSKQRRMLAKLLFSSSSEPLLSLLLSSDFSMPEGQIIYLLFRMGLSEDEIIALRGLLKLMDWPRLKTDIVQLRELKLSESMRDWAGRDGSKVENILIRHYEIKDSFNNFGRFRSLSHAIINSGQKCGRLKRASNNRASRRSRSGENRSSVTEFDPGRVLSTLVLLILLAEAEVQSTEKMDQ